MSHNGAIYIYQKCKVTLRDYGICICTSPPRGYRQSCVKMGLGTYTTLGLCCCFFLLSVLTGSVASSPLNITTWFLHGKLNGSWISPSPFPKFHSWVWSYPLHQSVRERRCFSFNHMTRSMEQHWTLNPSSAAAFLHELCLNWMSGSVTPEC